MKYLSLFTGIGGFEQGIAQAYVALTNRTKNKKGKSHPTSDVEKRARLVASAWQSADTKGGRFSELLDWNHDKGALISVGYSEIDKYAIQIYQKHFPKHFNYGDITKINADELPNFDCLVGGFPCQSFSIAGQRKGFDDTRGTLFFDTLRILKAKHPRFFVLENVKGLLSHDGGRTFKVIISSLAKLGYDLQWQVCNSANFNVPQNRERVFIVGHLRGTSRPEVFPFIHDDKVSAQADEANGRRPQTALSHTLRGSNIKADQTFIVENSARHEPRKYKTTAPTVQSSYGTGGGHIPFVDAIRRLTPTECERLQGFPDDWTAGVSDSQRYKTLGNAVTVNVVAAIFERLLTP